MEQQIFTFGQLNRGRGWPTIWTLKRLSQNGTLKTIRIGKRIYVARAEVERIEREGVALKPSHGTKHGTTAARSGGSSRKQ
jgi:hypothetical protein